MNVRPKNYEWKNFYDKVIELTAYTFTKKAYSNALCRLRIFTSTSMNFMHAISSESDDRIQFHQMVRKNLNKRIADEMHA